jgi:hypothetical protein
MSVEAILAALSTITNAWGGVATAWHVVYAVLVVLIMARAIPRAAAASGLALSALSVAMLAWWSGNPFNTGVFLVAGILMLRLATRMRSTAIVLGSRPEVVAGMLLVAFGAVYPHFLAATSWTAYLYLAPLGLIPCPTISAIAGVTLIADGFGSKAWSGLVAMMAIVYGLIGVLILGVMIDVAVIAAGVMLVIGLVTRAPSVARGRWL